MIIDDSPVMRLTAVDIDNHARMSGCFEVVRILGGFDFKVSLNDKLAKRMVIVLKRK